MIINAHELFSSGQQLPATGDAVSQRLDTSYMGNLGGAERPFLHIQTSSAALRSEGLSVLEVGLLHSEDGQRFEWAFSPVQGLEIRRSKSWAIVPTRLPASLKRFLMLRYRLTGDRLTAGAVTAFLSEAEAEKPRAERRMNPCHQLDYPNLGYHFPAGYNQPGLYCGE